MLNLAEYRQRPALLADWLPWAGLVAPGVVLNKDGSFQRSARFRGPDLDSATQGELIATSARLNNALRRLGSGWALFIEAERRAAADYPHSEFPEPLSWLVDEERRAAFEESGNHFESGYHLTLQYLPAEESRARAAGLLYENRPTEGVDWRERMQAFVAETDRIYDLLDGVMPEIAWLDDGQTLTYLHATISTRRYRVAVPEVPFHLDALLADAPLIGGLAPMLGDAHLRVATVRGFPTSTWPGILDDLNRLGFAYRWSTRFLCLDKAEAEKELRRLRRQWFAKRKNVVALLRETIFQQESPLVDTDASNKSADADAALQELGSDQVAFGHLTATVIVMDADAAMPDIPLFSSDMPGAERVPLNQIFVVDIADYERIMCAVTEGKVDLADLLQRAATANQNAVDGRLVLSQHIDWKGAERPDIPVLSAAATDARRRLIANLGGNPDELLKA